MVFSHAPRRVFAVSCHHYFHIWGEMLKLLPLICAAYFVASCSALADDQQKRFIEFPDGGDMTTYDLNTVQLIQPGKFTIIYTVVSNPDFMRLELKALDILREYCKRDDGLYPAPTDLLFGAA
jgi:hypothetical protein